MRGQRGFTLVEMVVVIAVLGVLFSILIGITRAVVSQQRYQLTRSRLANLDAAFAVYVSQNKRLPCPADGRLPSSDANAGLELGSGPPRVCTNSQQHGVVPWRTLGLTASDVEDGWGGRFTYRAGPDLVVDNAMDFTACDPAGSGAINAVLPVPPWCIKNGTGATECNSGTVVSTPSYCTPPATALSPNGSGGKGLVVENVAGSILMDPRGADGTGPSTGAAYVLVSHGPEGGGAYNGEGVLQASTVSAGTMESKNYADLAYAAPSAWPAAPAAFLVDDVINASTTGGHFDDIVSRPGILALAMKAGVGPRAH